MRPLTLVVGVCVVASTLWSATALAQPELVARAIAEARQTGDEVALVHLADEIGPAGVAECLEHAGRSGRILCAQAARYVDESWAVLPVLVSALDDHDRQVASCAAESATVLLLSMQPEVLGPQEPLPEEAEELLDRLRRLAGDSRFSLDIRAQVVVITGTLARLVGSSTEVPRRALEDSEVVVRRAAVGVLVGRTEPEDVSALVEAVLHDRDLLVVAQAAAGVCEATLGAGAALPEPVAERIGALLRDRRTRPSQLQPLLACLARSDHGQAVALQRLAAQHPSEAVRAVWSELTAEERP